MLRHSVSPIQDDWDQYLSCAEFEALHRAYSDARSAYDGI